MPYISQKAKRELATIRRPKGAGELNYTLTLLLLDSPHPTIFRLKIDQIISEYIRENGLKYQSFNDLAGAFMLSGGEFYRRTGTLPEAMSEIMADCLWGFYKDVVGPYEDNKIKENGDLYPPHLIKQVDHA